MHQRSNRLYVLFPASTLIAWSGLLFSAAQAQDQPKIKVACVGDSITFGARVENREENNYPTQLGQILGENYLVKNFGVSGTTLLSNGNKPWIKSRVFKPATQFNPDIVIIKLGTNDTKPGNYPDHADEFETDYAKLINHFRELPSEPQIYICTPAPVVPEQKPNPKIKDEVMVKVRPRIANVARDNGCNIIDLHMSLKDHPEWFPDGIHPNAQGARAMAETVARQLQTPLDSEFDVQKKFAAAGVENVAEGSFHGYTEYSFGLDKVSCKIVKPTVTAEGAPWVWRARFYGHQPQFDIAMLQQGWHICYCDVSNLFGSPTAVERWDNFYSLAQEFGLNNKPFLEGMSRGGLIVHNWAKAHPDQVCGIYGDNPVCDARSWPGGKGTGKGSEKNWRLFLEAYGLTEDEAAEFKGFPIDGLAPLAESKIPLLHIVGTADTTVPPAENTDILEARYKELGGPVEVIRKEGLKHHPHCLPNPNRIVDFALESFRQPSE